MKFARNPRLGAVFAGLLLSSFAAAPRSAATAHADFVADAAGIVDVRVSTDESLERAIGAPFDVVVEARLDIVPQAGDDYFAAERRGRAELIELFEAPAYSDENLDYSWAILDQGDLVIERIASPMEDARATLVGRSTWQLASLEAGERSLPAILWPDFDLPELAPAKFTGSLEPGATEPKPLAGFAPAPPKRIPESFFSPKNFGVGVLVLAAVALVVLLVRSRRQRVEVRMTPKQKLQRVDLQLMELAELVATGKSPSTDALRSAHFTLTAALRESVELDREIAGVATVTGLGAALTDHEWAHAMGAPAEVHDFFAATGMVKYAGDVPTAWGLADRIESANELRDVLVDSKPMAASGEAS